MPIEVSTIDSTIDWIIDHTPKLYTPNPETPDPEPTPIPKVPQIVKETDDYEKYYVPKVVSIGPYHFGKPNLQLVEKLKPTITAELFVGDQETLRSVYVRLGEMVPQLRKFYEPESTTEFSDEEFTKMMLLDSCFIFYYTSNFSLREYIKSYEISFVRRDLYLLENQIPLKVLKEVAAMVIKHPNLLEGVKKFVGNTCFVKRMRPKGNWLSNFKQADRFVVEEDDLNVSKKDYQNLDDEDDQNVGVAAYLNFITKPRVHHLLGAVHRKHATEDVILDKETFTPYKFYGCSFRNVSELADVGIHFEPIRDTRSMTEINFVKGWWRFSAKVELPPIVVNDHTKPMLLNLMAYERVFCSIRYSWVTSYVCFLDSLIDYPEDVAVLRKAWVLENSLGGDQEVVNMFSEISSNLVPSSEAYKEAKWSIQRHYESRRNRLYSQLKNEYFKSPWAIFALLGALVALFLSGVQTYYTKWSPEGPCDGLCKFLNTSHHL